MAAEAKDWGTRRLPATTARYGFAAIEPCDTFAARWPQVAGRLGIRVADRIDVLADGARWIWDRVQTYWPQTEGTLDVYHALEHVADAAKAMYGEGTPQTKRWLDDARDALLRDGYPGIERVITQARGDAVRGPQRTALTHLENYLRPHQRHLDYAGRLAEGRSIGSGMGEGACKNWIGRRMKQTGARWRIERAARMATLTGLIYTGNWQTYWAHAA